MADRAKPHAPRIIEEDRQMILLAAAELSLRRPGWLYVLGCVADRLQGREMFNSFRETSADLIEAAPEISQRPVAYRYRLTPRVMGGEENEWLYAVTEPLGAGMECEPLYAEAPEITEAMERAAHEVFSEWDRWRARSSRAMIHDLLRAALAAARKGGEK